ncbi:MAG: acyl-ACP desaturase [Acidimicrobiia bacterium]
MRPQDLLAAIAPVAEKLYDRHVGVAKEWFPHEMVPWSRGRDFAPGRAWDEADADMGEGVAPLPEAVRLSLYLNLLTEDNLPYYTRDVNWLFTGGGGAYDAWSRNWTAEEGRHSIVIRDWLTVSRATDLVALERARMAQVRGAQVPAPEDLFEGLAYLSMQELATRIAHRNTGKLIEDEAGQAIMLRVGNDENLHYLFYRDLATAALEVAPSEMVIGIERAVRTFAMPGTGIPDFERVARVVAKAGIYDLAIHHDQILEPVVLRHWKVADLTGLSDDAERAREALLERIARVGKVARRLAAERVPA